MNSVNLIGNLGKDLELRTTPGGKSVCTFDLAVNGYNNTTTWITIVAWGRTAELVCQHAGKGSKLGVTGRLQLRDLVTKDGEKRRSAEVVADNVYFTGSKKDNPNYEAPAKVEFEEMDELDSGELPFN